MCVFVWEFVLVFVPVCDLTSPIVWWWIGFSSISARVSGSIISWGVLANRPTCWRELSNRDTQTHTQPLSHFPPRGLWPGWKWPHPLNGQTKKKQQPQNISCRHFSQTSLRSRKGSSVVFTLLRGLFFPGLMMGYDGCTYPQCWNTHCEPVGNDAGNEWKDWAKDLRVCAFVAPVGAHLD